MWVWSQWFPNLRFKHLHLPISQQLPKNHTMYVDRFKFMSHNLYWYQSPVQKNMLVTILWSGILQSRQCWRWWRFQTTAPHCQERKSGRQAAPRAPLCWPGSSLHPEERQLHTQTGRQQTVTSWSSASLNYRHCTDTPSRLSTHWWGLQGVQRQLSQGDAAVFHLSSTQVHTILPDRKAQRRCLNELIL